MVTQASILANYENATQQIRQRVLDYAQRVWSSSPSFRDADIDRIIARIVPVVQGGQLQIAQLTDAYIGQQSVLAGMTWTAGVDRSVIDYRDVPFDDVYRRPAVEMYTALSNGIDYPQAVNQGLDRLLSIAATDLQQSKNRTASASIGRSGFKWFARALTGRENCALCVIASTQRYHRGDLMPIHPGCDCNVVTMRTKNDPGQIIDQNLLDQTHAAIESKLGSTDRGARDLGIGKTNVKDRPLSDFTELIVTREHGELGPILTWRSDHFTGPNDI